MDDEKDPSKWSSRKLIISCATIGLLMVLPVIYKHLAISDSVTLLVLGATASVAGVYNLSNVVAKKYDQSSDG